MAKKKWDDLVAVITGASSGIGRATAAEFAKRNATVVLAARREKGLGLTAEECRQLGGSVLTVPTDVSKSAAVEQLASLAVKTYGKIDVWVNNAAVSVFGNLHEIPTEAIQRVVETNIMGYIHGARAAIAHFRVQGRGTLVNVSSVAGVVGQPFSAPYVVSKFAIRGLSESLSQEVLDAPDIHICSVLPAFVDTPLFQEAANYLGKKIRAPRPLTTPFHVASAIARLVDRPKPEIMVGRSSRFPILIHDLAPRLSDRMVRRKILKEQFEDFPAAVTNGNLFRPMDEWARTTGGWKSEERLEQAFPAPAPKRSLLSLLRRQQAAVLQP